MRLIDVDKLIKKISSVCKLAKSDPQKALIGRIIYIIENMPTMTDGALNPTEEKILSMFRKYHTEAVDNKAIYDPVSWALYQVWTYYDNRRTSWRRDKHDADAENPEIPE